MSSQTKMATSLINHLVSFSTDAALRPTDLGRDAELYSMHVGCKSMTIALGALNETLVGKGILYYPIYEIVGDFVSREVGVFELTPAEQMGVVGPDGAPEIDRLGEPIFYDEDMLFDSESDGDADDHATRSFLSLG